jgi:hypothetical protein
VSAKADRLKDQLTINPDEVPQPSTPAAPPPVEVAPEPELEPASAASPEPLPARPAPTKYTLLLNGRDEERARRVVDDVVQRVGLRPVKGQRAGVIRLLFALADEDEALRGRLAERLRAVELRRRAVELRRRLPTKAVFVGRRLGS